MSLINIRGATAINDPEYRYKMPSIVVKIEGRKTIIPNISQVASALHRDPAEVTKFFGCELGSQTTFNPETDRAVVNGSHVKQKLQTYLFKYIEKFVLCPRCKLPETIYEVTNGDIISTCAACGTKELLALTHKLTVFILAQDKKKKKQKIYRKSDTKEINHWKKAQNSTCVLKVEIEQGEEEEVEVEAAAEDVSKVTLDDITDGMTAKEAAVNTLSKYFAAPSDGKTPEQVVEYIRSLQTGSSLMLKECAYIMIGAAFDQNVVKAGQVSVYAKILRALVATDANKFMARHIIGAVEDFFGSKYPSLAKAFPLVLKQLYDEDILEEEVILDWAGQGVTYEFSPQSMTGEQIKELRASAESFITWLKEADEDDDDADDEGL